MNRRYIGRWNTGFLICDEAGICTFANARAEELYQKAGHPQSLIGRRYEELDLTGKYSQEEIMAGGTWKQEVQTDRYVLEENISAIRENGVYQGILVILRDKTKIRQMEDEIAYRAALIHEVHHRVKNNLQTIISLVGLEAAQKKDAEVKAFAKTITGYIRSMSMTYDLLAHTGAEAVDLKTMLARIIDCVLESWSVRGCRIHVEVTGDDLELPEHVASTVALIVNELVTNSIKYAFCDREEGSIFLTIATMQNELGWVFWPIVVGLISCLLGMGASLLGFWMSTVRMLYSMANKNFLPKIFAKVNKNKQPLLPNIFLLILSFIFIVLQNSSDFMSAFFNLMSFGCACAYALTMISAVCIHHKHPDWKSSNTVKGGDAFRIFAMVIAITIAFFCTLGQGVDSWICFFVYLGIGGIIWLWMNLVNWKKQPVEIETPDGIRKF